MPEALARYKGLWQHRERIAQLIGSGASPV